jgi:hypothetical protein
MRAMSGFRIHAKSLLLAGAVIVILVTAIIFLIARGNSPKPAVAVLPPNNQNAANAPSAANGNSTGTETLDKKSRRVVLEMLRRRQNGGSPSSPPWGRMEMPQDPVERRVVFAKVMNERFAGHKLTAHVAAIGDQHTVFSISWPANAVDKDHMEKLKQATPLHAELRSQGFLNIKLMIGDKTDWTKKL